MVGKNQVVSKLSQLAVGFSMRELSFLVKTSDKRVLRVSYEFFQKALAENSKGDRVMEELKKCPFCGGEAKMKVSESTLNTLITCPNCNVTMKNNFKGHRRVRELLEELAIEAWNRRVE